MSLFRHRVTVRTMTQPSGDDGTRDEPFLGASAVVRVGFETSPQGVDFSEYGVEQAHGARLFCLLKDRCLFPVKSEVTWLGDIYTVLALPAPMLGITLNHAAVLLQRQTEDVE